MNDIVVFSAKVTTNVQIFIIVTSFVFEALLNDRQTWILFVDKNCTLI